MSPVRPGRNPTPMALECTPASITLSCNPAIHPSYLPASARWARARRATGWPVSDARRLRAGRSPSRGSFAAAFAGKASVFTPFISLSSELAEGDDGGQSGLVLLLACAYRISVCVAPRAHTDIHTLRDDQGHTDTLLERSEARSREPGVLPSTRCGGAHGFIPLDAHGNMGTAAKRCVSPGAASWRAPPPGPLAARAVCWYSRSPVAASSSC